MIGKNKTAIAEFFGGKYDGEKRSVSKDLVVYEFIVRQNGFDVVHIYLRYKKSPRFNFVNVETRATA